MTSWIHYHLISAISTGALYILYHLLFRSGSHFKFNRIYLQGTLLFSLLLPFLPAWGNSVLISNSNIFIYDEFPSVAGAISGFNNIILDNNSSSIFINIGHIYLIIIGIMILWKGSSLLRLLRFTGSGSFSRLENIKFKLLNKDVAPFSIFNKIYIPTRLISNADLGLIIKHEVAHGKYGHTFDLIMIELLLILQWFNPFLYLIRKTIRELHEFEADQEVIMTGIDPVQYMGLLISHGNNQTYIPVSSHFDNSLIYKRFKMMTAAKTHNIKPLKILFVIPFFFCLVLFSSFIRTNPSTILSVIPGNNSALFSLIEYTSEIPGVCPIQEGDVVKIASGFGMRIHPIYKKEMMHKGIDIVAKQGTPVIAPAEGTVRVVNMAFKPGEGYGRFIIIDHAEYYSTLFAQLSGYAVKAGQSVIQGQTIGFIGSSGMSTAPHLHYEVKKDGKNVDPKLYF